MSVTEFKDWQDNAPIRPVQEREMAMLLALAAIVIGYLNEYPALYGIAGTILVLGLLVPVFFRPLARLWLAVTRLLGLVISRLVLTLIYFLVVTPIGLIRRWSGRDTMHIGRFKKDKGSVYSVRDKRFESDDLERPY